MKVSRAAQLAVLEGVIADQREGIEDLEARDGNVQREKKVIRHVCWLVTKKERANRVCQVLPERFSHGKLCRRFCIVQCHSGAYHFLFLPFYFDPGGHVSFWAGSLKLFILKAHCGLLFKLTVRCLVHFFFLFFFC